MFKSTHQPSQGSNEKKNYLESREDSMKSINPPSSNSKTASKIKSSSKKTSHRKSLGRAAVGGERKKAVPFKPKQSAGSKQSVTQSHSTNSFKENLGSGVSSSHTGTPLGIHADMSQRYSFKQLTPVLNKTQTK